MPPRRERFTAEVRKQGVNPYVEVPSAVSAAFADLAEHGRVRVHGTLEGTEIRGTLVPRGGGHWLFLHSGMRAAAGVGVGDAVELSLSAVPWDVVPLPRDAQAALEQAGVVDAFEARSPGERHELCRRYTLEQVFARSDPAVRELFERLRTLVASMGPVHEQAYRVGEQKHLA